MQFSSKFHVIVPAFWWLMMCPPITKVSETSLPSFSADALMHDHWKGSRLSHNLDWSLAQQHISVQFTSIHSFAGINDAQNKNMELFFQCFFPLHNEIRHLPWFHFICRNDCFSVCSIGTHVSSQSSRWPRPVTHGCGSCWFLSLVEAWISWLWWRWHFGSLLCGSW